MSQALGVIDATYAGTLIDSEKGSKLKLAGWMQKPVVTNGQVHYSREFDAGEFTCTTVLKRGQRISDLYPTGTAELQCNCDTGQSYTFPDAFISNLPEMTAGEGGKIELKFALGVYEELLNG